MNPFFRDPREPIPFSKLSKDNIISCASILMEKTELIRQEIIAADVSDKNGRLLKFDDLNNEIDRVLAPLHLVAETHPNASFRNAANESIQKLNQYLNELNLDESLYQALKSFAESEAAHHLNDMEKRYCKQMLDDYHRNGFQLPPDQRDRLKELNNSLDDETLKFEQNISASDSYLILEESDLDGLSDDFKQAHRQEDGKYKITTDYPSYVPFMKLAHSREVRKKLYFLYLNRAVEQNLPLLSRILNLRCEKAELLNFKDYSEYVLESKMAKKPAAVWHFLETLSQKVVQKAKSDYRALCETADLEQIFPWDRPYLTNKIMESQYQLEDEEIRGYFPLEKVFEGLFDFVQTLYGLKIQPVEMETWHKSVRSFEMLENGERRAVFYLDLFPRPNKYTHAAHFGIQDGKQLSDCYQMPQSALVCNFTKPVGDKPSLLSHDEVETLFHEFGHLCHSLMSNSPLSSMAGTNVLRDFVETPSQFLENWVWEKEALKRFARHYQTNEPIPDQLVDKMIEAKHLNSGLDTQQQLFYAALDMKYHGGFNPSSPEETTKVMQEVQDAFTLFPWVEGTHFQAGFGHLTGYAASYYGYQWARVYAQDLFSIFKENGIYDPKTGKRFRDQILAKGDTEDPIALVKSFLGREPKMDAFLDSLGIH